MGATLKDHASFCIVGGLAVFLDMRAGRYFCLSSRSNDAFVDLTRGQPISKVQSQSALKPLFLRDVLLQTAGDERPEPAIPPPMPKISLIEEEQNTPRVHPLPVLASLAVAAIALARHPIVNHIRSVRKLKTQYSARNIGKPADQRLKAICAAFYWSALLTSSHDKCLLRSLAMTRYLIGRGYSPIWVFGVKEGPFAAHCWVQQGDALLNDRMERVRCFTPILVV